jgi:hypothetical protein
MKLFGVSFLNGTTFHCVNKQSLPQLLLELERHRYDLVYLDGSLITDQFTLFQTIRAAIPSEYWFPGGNRKWDSFNSSLDDVLLHHSGDRIAVIWTSAEKMLEGKLPLLLYAAQVIDREAAWIRRAEPPWGRNLWLRVFLVGEGPNFPHMPKE